MDHQPFCRSWAYSKLGLLVVLDTTCTATTRFGWFFGPIPHSPDDSPENCSRHCSASLGSLFRFDYPHSPFPRQMSRHFPWKLSRNLTRVSPIDFPLDFRTKQNLNCSLLFISGTSWTSSSASTSSSLEQVSSDTLEQYCTILRSNANAFYTVEIVLIMVLIVFMVYSSR